jgi:hypothetical protein
MAISKPGPNLGQSEVVILFPGISITIHPPKPMYSLIARY